MRIHAGSRNKSDHVQVTASFWLNISEDPVPRNAFPGCLLRSAGGLLTEAAMIRRVWRLVTHHENKEGALAWCRANNRITVGWGRLGDLRRRSYSSPADLNASVQHSYPEERAQWGGPSLWNFSREMRIGDAVVLSSARGREAVAIIDGDYEWCSAGPMVNGRELTGEHNHQRRVRFVSVDPNVIWRRAGGKPATGQNIRSTLILCADPVDIGD